MRLLVLIALLLVGCGDDSYFVDSRPDNYWNEELTYYYNEFVSDAAYYGTVLLDTDLRVLDYRSQGSKTSTPKLLWKKDESYVFDSLGVCLDFKQEQNFEVVRWSEIWILDSLKDDSLPYLTWKLILYHELGHCILGKDHEKDGIMQERLPADIEIEDSWDRWIEEFFNE